MADTEYVSGLKELLVRLQSLADAVGEKKAAKPVSAALRKAGIVLQKAAQDNLTAHGNVKSGALRENIIVTKKRGAQPGMVTLDVTIRAKAKAYADNSKNRRSGKIGKQYTNYGPLFYARFLEFGTSHQLKSPFLRPAFEQHKGELPEIFKVSLSAALEKVGQ